MAAKMWTLACAMCIALLQTTAADNVLGCGGFVKSNVDINFSRVEVKLYTPHGSIKYQTDCAPNTGYYLIPLYDKGDFILRVEPPRGWSFEPMSVDVHVDGSTDKCSLGEDINFKFTGFSVVGQVVSKGLTSGPEGVTLTLTAVGAKDALQTVTSGQDGSYSFAEVLPGEYLVRASHPKWTLETEEVKVKVVNDNGNAGNTITVSGYDVSGQVMSDGEAIRGVNFVLYSSNVKPQSVTGCEKTPLKAFTNREKSPPLCYVTSKEDGTFTWPSLPSGTYTVVSFYKGENIVFDVKPERMAFTVEHQSVKITEVFLVAGFSVSGRVLDSKGGGGVAGAKVLIEGKETATTTADGVYHLDNMKTGSYRISVTASKMTFEEVTVKVTPNTPLLPDILATAFGLCGKVTIDRVPEGLSGLSSQRRVIYYPEGKAADAISIATEADGSFCAQVTPGNYAVRVHLSDAEVKAGLHLAPAEKKVTISNKPILNIVFSQFRAKVSGSVTCMEKCGLIEISLDPVGRADGKQVVRVKETPKGGTFLFEDVMPGKYKVNMLQDSWCWKEKTLDIEVVDTDLSSLIFSQTGYILKCSISHAITLHFAHEKKSGSVGSFQLSKGTNRFCLAQPGVYRLSPDSCHKFEKPVYTYDTSNPVMLTLTAVQHEVQGTVTTTEPVTDIIVTIKSSVEEAPVVLPPLQLAVADKKVEVGAKAPASFLYNFSHLARSGEKLEISVKSKEVLFYPPRVEFVVPEDRCSGDEIRFEGRQGVFISGSISPPLEGATITVVARGDSNAFEPVTLVTDASGKFRLGPLHSDMEYDVTAEKMGFALVRKEGVPIVFRAFKLGQIEVKVEDGARQALDSVLVSLSGESQYRSNLLTGDNGTLLFSQLIPGQYFLRPMMKEYRFEPVSQSLEVVEGTVKQLTFTGTRVAFSCYGRVSSLNGEAEPGVTVEALGREDCETSMEEVKTDQDGAFRLRGLQPKCTYVVQLRTGEVNAHIERTVPKTRVVKVDSADHHDVNIIAFRRMNQMDLSGNIKTAHANLPTLKVRLFREDSPDSPVHTIQLAKSAFFYLPSLPIDSKKYTLRLESSLSKALYSYSLPEVAFTANTTYRHFTLQFQPQPRPVEQELQQGSVLVLPLLALLALLVYNYRKVLPMLSQGVEQVQAMLQRQPLAEVMPVQESSGGDGPNLKRRVKPRKT